MKCFVVLVACGGLLVACSESGSNDVASRASSASAELPSGASLLFVVRGDASSDDGTLTIEVGEVDWFTDRPVRRAGVTTSDALAALWQVDFADDPPNAAISAGDVDAVLILDSASPTEDGIEFEFTPVRGDVRNGNLGSTSLFIDSTSAPACDGAEIDLAGPDQPDVPMVTVGTPSSTWGYTGVINWGDGDSQALPDGDRDHNYEAGTWHLLLAMVDPDGADCQSHWTVQCDGTYCTEP